MEQPSSHTPHNVEVRGWRDGRVAMRQICESEDEALALVEQWAEMGMTRVEIDDLSAHHGGDAILDPDVEIEPADEPSEKPV
jgi:hypothetical protein